MATLAKGLGNVLRDAVGFGLFFTGVVLEAAGRTVSDNVDGFADELRDDLPEGDQEDEFDAPMSARGQVAVTKSAAAQEMLREGLARVHQDELKEPRPRPLAGSVTARFPRGA